MINRFEVGELKKRINLIEKHVFIVSIPLSRHTSDNAVVGEETLATYSLNEAWENYSYYIQKVVFRMKQSIKALEKIFEGLNQIISDGKESDLTEQLSIPCSFDAYELAYECEDMIIAFARLFEQEYTQDTVKYLGKTSFAQEFKDNIPSRNDPNGLFWRVNILRNRMAHSTRGAYCNAETAGRYMDIIPVPHMIEYKNGDVIIESNVPDLEKNPRMQTVIDEAILQKKYGEELSKQNIFDILFPETKAKGHGKRKPLVYYANNERFDYHHGFISISNQILDVIDRQVLVFLKAGLEKADGAAFQEKWMYDDNQSITISELYDSNLRMWKDIS